MPWYAGRLRSSPTAHKSYKAEWESSAVWFGLLHHQLYQIPRLQPVLVAKPVEHAKPLGRAIGDRHAPGELFDRVATLDLDHLQPQRLRRGDLIGRHATERAERVSEALVHRLGSILRRVDDAVDLAAEPHHVEPKRPLVALGGRGRRREAADHHLLDGLGVDVFDPAGVEILRQGLFGRHTDDVEAQRLRAVVFDAEHRLRRVIEYETLRRGKGEAELRMQEFPSAHEALARVLAEHDAIEVGEVLVLLALAGAGTGELAGVGDRVGDALRCRRMRRQEVRR